MSDETNRPPPAPQKPDWKPAERAGSGEDSAKVRQILDGARRVFLELGFDGASMGDIARAASVSKGTLYVYFDSKEVLFASLVADERRRAKPDFDLDPRSTDVAGTLSRYGRAYIPYISRAGNIDLLRTVMGIAERFPRVGEEFYRDGPKRGRDFVRGFVEAQVAAGRLRVDDPALAAAQFIGLLQAGVLNVLLFGVRNAPDEAEVARIVDGAVAMFLARYGV
ncbi:MAG TPA: TetR/AcrR family transcriptional regulator [Bauldia sp.]|nr:TetR/AcrR family transcriptional regulator [Bauldia sp.]